MPSDLGDYLLVWTAWGEQRTEFHPQETLSEVKRRYNWMKRNAFNNLRMMLCTDLHPPSGERVP